MKIEGYSPFDENLYLIKISFRNIERKFSRRDIFMYETEKKSHVIW